MSLNEIAEIIEGVLFVAGEGVEIDEFKTKFDMNDREFNKCLDILKAKYNEKSGINIIQYKNKVQLCSNPKIVDNISEILNPIRERSLTKAALETVAIIAYKQPITRLEIENIRGANSDYAIQLLQSNNLIEVVGRKDSVGKPLLFGTTENFLKRFELNSIESLPNYNELLDRIRVIHSDGDSLYREFTIPEDDDDKKPTELNQNVEPAQTQNDVTSNSNSTDKQSANQNDNSNDSNSTNEPQSNEEVNE